MKMIYLKDLLEDAEKYLEQEILIRGWIRNHRKQKEFGFIVYQMVPVLNLYK